MKILRYKEFSEKLDIKPANLDKIYPKNPELPNWLPDDFVSWDEIATYWAYDYAFVDRNREKCDRDGVPEDCRCSICQKEIKKGYKTLYWKAPEEKEYLTDGRGSSSRWYAVPGEGREPAKVGNTCFKALKKAHKDIYK